MPVYGNVRSTGISEVELIVRGPSRVPASGVIGLNWWTTVTATMQPTLIDEDHSTVVPGGGA